jgi:hypothetical protein
VIPVTHIVGDGETLAERHPGWARLCNLMPKDPEVKDLPVPANPGPNNGRFPFRY